MKLENLLLEESIKKGKIPLDEGFKFFKEKKDIVELKEELLGFSSNILTKDYYNKIKEELKNIRIKKRKMSKEVVAYSLKKRIYINENRFFSLTKKAQMEYVLHEILHIMQEKDKNLVSQGKFIYSFLNSQKIDKKQSLSEIIIGRKNLSKRYFNDKEIIPYLLNHSIDFKYLKEGSRETVLSYLKEGNIFNMNSTYWKEKFK